MKTIDPPNTISDGKYSHPISLELRLLSRWNYGSYRPVKSRFPVEHSALKNCLVHNDVYSNPSNPVSPSNTPHLKTTPSTTMSTATPAGVMTARLSLGAIIKQVYTAWKYLSMCQLFQRDDLCSYIVKDYIHLTAKYNDYMVPS